MRKQITITLDDHGYKPGVTENSPQRYSVLSLVNTTEFMIGQYVDKPEVDSLIERRDTKVVIKAAK